MSSKTQSMAKPIAIPRRARLPPTYIGFRVQVNTPVVASASVGSDGRAVVPMRRKIRLAPIFSATPGKAVISTVGRPPRSSSLASVAPLRVPVPHVAVRITACMPCCRMSWAISAPILAMVLMLAMFPVVT